MKITKSGGQYKSECQIWTPYTLTTFNMISIPRILLEQLGKDCFDLSNLIRKCYVLSEL